MKTIVLSDHTGDMIAESERNRDQNRAERASAAEMRDAQIDEAYDKAFSEYQRDLAVWNGKSWVQKLLLFFLKPQPPSREDIAKEFPAPRRPRPRQTISSDEEQVWRAGSEGERRVSEYLGRRLDDRWTLLSGYRGPGGEIDHILVGPLGVCALETKYLNGAVFVDGDSWKLDKYDNYGNLVETGQPVLDRGGRSPSAQINGSVKPLQEFLDRRNNARRIGRAVILAHDKSRVSRVEDQTVDYIGTLDGLNVDMLFQSSQSPLDRASADSVVQRIARDHRHHSQRRNKRGRRRGPPSQRGRRRR